MLNVGALFDNNKKWIHTFKLFFSWHNSCGNKLRTYRLFKDEFVFEPYLNWGTYNQRNILTKFRISSHKPEIEKGRYMNIPTEQRICRLCKLDVENEIHFLLECPSQANTRREILDQIESRFSNLKFFDNKIKLSGFFQQMITTFIISYTFINKII